MKIIAFEWDFGKGEDYNGKSLFIGQHLPKAELDEPTHVETYGVALSAADETKNFMLHRHSCHVSNIIGEVRVVTKEEARELLVAEIDRTLAILYSESEMKAVDRKFNDTSLINPDEDDSE
jgi:hypothetical protein